MNPERTIGVTWFSNIKIEKKDAYQRLDWEEFKEIWTIQKIGKINRFALEYILEAKKIVEGLGYSFIQCTFNFSKKEEPLIIVIEDILPEEERIAIAIAPRIIGDA